MPEITVVMVTRNRRDQTLASLDHLSRLPERPAIIVVDNASSDGTAAAVSAAYPAIRVIWLSGNEGAAARTRGVREARTEVVAFADDDSWWAPGALSRASRLMREHPRLGLIAARVLVGPEERLDPVCAEMAASPLGAHPAVPGWSCWVSWPAVRWCGAAPTLRSVASHRCCSSSARRRCWRRTSRPTGGTSSTCRTWLPTTIPALHRATPVARACSGATRCWPRGCGARGRRSSPALLGRSSPAGTVTNGVLCVPPSAGSRRCCATAGGSPRR